MNLIHKYGILKRYNSNRKKRNKDGFIELFLCNKNFFKLFPFDTFFLKNVSGFNLTTDIEYKNIDMNLYYLNIASISNVAFSKHMYESIIRHRWKR